MSTWDLSKIYSSEEEVNQEMEEVRANLEELEELLNQFKTNLLTILQLSEKIQRASSRLISYSMMKRDEDSREPQSQRRLLDVRSLLSEVDQKTSSIRPQILSLSKEEIEDLLADDSFERYHRLIERISRFKAHTLSDKEEFIISSLAPAMSTPQNDYYMLQNADMRYGVLDGTDQELTDANYISFLLGEDRELRQKAFEKMYEVQSSFKNTISSTLYANVRDLVQISKLRKYSSARQMELYEDDVPEAVYDTLIDMVHEYLPTLHRFYELRQKRLGLEESHMWDVYVPITKSDKKYSFEEAKDMVIEASKPLGKAYQELMRRAFEERWIDAYPREGKASGAYSFGNYDSDPYILMNYTEDLNSVFTLMHELGHSMHSYFSRKYNEFLDSGYTIFVAEVASTFNENLLIEYLMERAESVEEKIHILNHHIDSFKSTVFRQTMFAEFERETHRMVEEGQGLTSEDFNKLYIDLNKKYFGEAVVSDELIQYEWMRIPHFYRNFYVYKYATGFSSATILANNVLNGTEEDLEAYLAFLKDGNKHFPLEQLRMAGCDIGNPEVLRQAFEVFKRKVDELERLI